MRTESRAHLVYYNCLCGKFMEVYSAVASQADIVPLIQNFSNWNTENLEVLILVIQLFLLITNTT